MRVSQLSALRCLMRKIVDLDHERDSLKQRCDVLDQIADTLTARLNATPRASEESLRRERHEKLEEVQRSRKEVELLTERIDAIQMFVHEVLWESRRVYARAVGDVGGGTRGSVFMVSAM